ncbi:MAG: hypothetical protein KME08_18750 [Aphanothece sp. CMT-3BRIN-NPC111]|nr:hypothetical protein [Aphanothece sp. CMT-3BRIN-NPC111]
MRRTIQNLNSKILGVAIALDHTISLNIAMLDVLLHKTHITPGMPGQLVETRHGASLQ